MVFPVVLELVALLGFPGVAALFEASLPPSLVRKNNREEVDKKIQFTVGI